MTRAGTAVLGVGLLAAVAGIARADEVTKWNGVMLDAIRATGAPPPRASRAMAIVSTAVYDAVNSIDRLNHPYAIDTIAPAGTSREAAAAAAAHRALIGLFPTQQAALDNALATSLATIPDGVGKTGGINLGVYVGEQMLALRSTDGWDASPPPYLGSTDPGKWRPTPPGFAPGLLPAWGNVRPFGVMSATQFVLPGPPGLDSPAYAAAYNEVKEYGRKTGSSRTAEQTEIAKVWAAGAGTVTPPGQWNQIATQIGESRGQSLHENARMLAFLNIATADAAICCWNAKYAYEMWRPVTAIVDAELDGNPDTVDDDTWEPLLTTPPFPTYTSGHSTFSSSSAAVLAAYFGGDAVSFTLTGEDVGAGITRAFTSLSAAAQEAGQSRIYGGIHFQFDNQDALAAGGLIGQWVFDHYLGVIPAPGSGVVLGMGVIAVVRRRRSN